MLNLDLSVRESETECYLSDRERLWSLGRYRLLEKYMFVSHTKHTQRKNNGSTSFTIDNIYYLNFRIYEQESVPWCGEIQNQKLEVLGNTFNLHSNSAYAQKVWSLNQFICMCLREN